MCSGLPSCSVRPSVCVVVFRSGRRSMYGCFPFYSARHAWRSSFPPGAAYATVFRSARCGIRGGLPFCLAWPGMHGSVPFCLARPSVRGSVPFGLAWYRCSVLSDAVRCAQRSSVLPFFRSARRSMRGVLPFRLGRHAWWCSVLSGAAWYARRCSVLPGAVYTAVFHSARRGIGVTFCLSWPGVCGGPLFCLAQHAWRCPVLLGAACAAFFHSGRGGLHGGLPFRPVRHTRQCSILSGAAWYARWCSVLPGAAYAAVFCSARCGICGGVPFCPVRPGERGGVAGPS